MSGTLEPTLSQTSITFSGIDEATEKQPRRFTKELSKNEYVAGNGYGKNINTILNRNGDILTKKFGDSIIAEMLRDPEIKKCDTVIKISVLSDGISIFPAVSKPAPLKPLAEGEEENLEQKRERLTREKEIARYELAQKYANFATRAISNIDGFRSKIENMLDAVTYGNKVAEQTYKEEYDKDFGRTLLTLSSIRVKPRTSTRFVLNKYRELVGIQTIVTNNKGQDESIILPREKFLVLTFRGKDEDPRGTSILEAVYNAWYLKMQLWPEYLRWLLQCAIPSLVGYTSDKSDGRKVLKDAETGEILRDADGNPVYEAEVESLLNALIQVRNSTAIALPNGAKVEPINNSVSGDPFKGLRDVLNEEIEMGLILQTLATSEGRNMSRAASQTHMSVLDLFIFFIKGLVIDMITNDLLKPLMLTNFANFDMTLLPKVSMGDTERRDWATDATALATLYKSGFIGESQKIGFDKQIGAPDRDVESDNKLAQEALESAQAMAIEAKTAQPATPAATPSSAKPATQPTK